MSTPDTQAPQSKNGTGQHTAQTSGSISLYALFKKVKDQKRKELIIGTHDNYHHADDAACLGMLDFAANCHQLEIDLRRTRNPNELQHCDIVFDVGQIHAPKNYRFDHHGSSSGAGRLSKSATKQAGKEVYIPYSGIGLLWKNFGEEFVRMAIKRTSSDETQAEAEPWMIEKVTEEMDQRIIQGICAHDAGMTGQDNKDEEVVRTMTLAEAMQRMNVCQAMRGFGPELQKRQMFRAAGMFINTLIPCINSSIDLQINIPQVKAVIQECKEKGNQILVVNTFSSAWRVLIASAPQILFVIQQQTDERGTYAVLAVPTGNNKFRALLPDEWSDHGAEALSAITGIHDAVFCHKERFHATALSQGGAIKLAKKAIETWNANQKS